MSTLVELKIIQDFFDVFIFIYFNLNLYISVIR